MNYVLWTFLGELPTTVLWECSQMSPMWCKMVSYYFNLILNIPSLFASDEIPSNFYNQMTSSLMEILNDLLQVSGYTSISIFLQILHKFTNVIVVLQRDLLRILIKFVRK